MCPKRAAPFVVGQWVRGESFYGRRAHIAEILGGPRDRLWLLGTRRIGKTSLLRQLEAVASGGGPRGFLPLYWDLQGAEDPVELGEGLREALLDGERQFRAAGVAPPGPGADNPFEALERLRDRALARGRKLLLLWDEAEELIGLGRDHPSELGELRRLLGTANETRAVVASTLRLRDLADPGTARFLSPFAPLFLRGLEDDEARSLVAQEGLPAAERPAIDEETAGRIRARSGNHPYLLQLLSRRYLELGDAERAFRELCADDMIAAFFFSDLDALPPADAAVMAALGERPLSSGELSQRLCREAPELDASVRRLVDLGFVRRQDDRLRVSNSFFGAWLREGRRRPDGAAAGGDSAAPSPRATQILADLGHAPGPDAASAHELLELVYEPLRRLARGYLGRERPGHTLQPTALVHEAYLRLVDQSRVDWKGRTHFFAVGAKLMRRILIDHARSRKRVKRGGGRLRVTLSGLAALPAGGGDLGPEQLLALHASLERLAKIDRRQARVVELRFFGGLTGAEAAAALGVSRRTVESDWAKARAWLEHDLAGHQAER